MPPHIKATYQELTSQRWIYHSCARRGWTEAEYCARIREYAQWVRSRCA